MVDFHKGFEGFDKLSSEKKKAKEEGLILSKESEAGKEKDIKLESSPRKAEAFYEDILKFVKQVLDKVASGRENELRGEEIHSWIVKKCDYFLEFIKPDDVMNIVFGHDEYEKSYIYNHSVNVCIIATHIAYKLDYSRENLENLALASLFHDIGMMKIPEHIWNKGGKLNSSEVAEVRKHPAYGEEIFRKLTGIDEVVSLVIGQHQERSDGTGYPNHLKGSDIHYMARLVSLVLRYEALTHTRRWRVRFSPDKAIQEILDNEGDSYDPEFMKALLRYVSIFPVGSWVKISTGEIGTVIKVNENTPMRPVINIVFNREKKRFREPHILDLSKQLLIYVEHCIDPEEVKIL